MSDNQEKILVVEDDEGVAFLQCRVLERAGFRAESVATEKAALEFLARERVDLVILDYRLSGQRTGLHLYTDMKDAGFNVPVIVVTGFSDEMIVIRALRAGVRDFVSKSNDYLEYIPDAVDRVLAQIRLEKRLADSEARFRSYMDHLPAVSFIKDDQGHIVYANQRFESLFPQVDWRGKTEGELFPCRNGHETAGFGCVAEFLDELTSTAGRRVQWRTHSFPIHGTLGAPLFGVVAFELDPACPPSAPLVLGDNVPLASSSTASSR